MIDTDIHLGMAVRFTWHLTRRSQYTDTVFDKWGSSRKWVKRWETASYPGQKEPQLRDGILIGVRTLIDGYNSGGGYEDPIVFVPERRFRAYLIAVNMHSKPVYVLPEHVEVTSRGGVEVGVDDVTLGITVL